MRILHTSDWHLGRTLHGVDLLEHQAAYLDHLVELARDEDVDAVLVAGDVYDRAIPPVEAVTLLSDAVRRLAEHAHVVLTSGNHDSAVRLGFGAALMRPEVHIRAAVAGVADPVVVPARDGGAPALVYALPYLDPDACRASLADPPTDPGAAPVLLARSHEAVMSAAVRRVAADLARRRALPPGADAGPHAPAVLMGHAFVVGGQASESERDIRVGGVDAVPAGVFAGAGLDYLALGHLHGPQAVSVPADGAPTLARYSGSPLAYSFSEMHQKKSTVLLDLREHGPLGEAGDAGAGSSAELVPAPVPRRLADLTGPLDDLLGAAGADHVDDWLRVTVTDAARPTELVARVKARFPHALQVKHQPAAPVERETIAVVGTAADPLVVARDFVDHVTGAPPSDAETAVLRDALEAALASERSA
ncbi:exodeoxyribonuclease I subunit D [Sediminihabitans luteus]|uniref:Nuclease SbcCD subunit D n=1 Tax=Sediminihabitans luteus TaxID=1138585 RepID=A0A2M9CD80_9CELL|nr:exonuclease SbcCD subunit D [Sediminihabitans luteus]PJJ69286.1 exodeoxyribonuclease I subunit D [Sediminihabitans luteus]GII98968.1 nuclease SbcCD subunit D [Sediminihabitans luteus]